MASYILLAGDDAITTMSVSMTSEDPEFPASNITDYDPSNVSKATAGATVYTLTRLAGAFTPELFAIFNHNLTGATVTLQNTAGLNQSVLIPSRTSDGQCEHAFLDLRGLANRNAATWTLTISGVTGVVQIGRLSLGAPMHRLDLLTEDPGIGLSSDWPVRAMRTFLQTDLIYDMDIRIRRFSGKIGTDEMRALFLAAAQSSKGINIPLVLIPNDDVNSALYVRLSKSTVEAVQKAGVGRAAECQVELVEVSNGIPLGGS